MNESSQTFDAVKYKRTQHDQWNEDSESWYRWTSTLQDWFGRANDLMLELAQLGPGQRVLDIATGAGEPALSAASRVGPKGYVLATDLSENMLQFAKMTAAERGLRNFETLVMDGEHLDLPDDSFDAVFCRLGLMYMPDKQQALSEWRRVLKPGGRVVVMVFSTPDRNPWGSVPISIIRKRAQLPPPLPGQPGPFSLGREGLLDETLRQASFLDVETYPISTPLRMSSVKEAIQFAREAFGALNQMMAHLPRMERDAIWDEVVAEMRAYEGANGFEAACEPIIGVGVK
jgi:SAM-dependent methyltransferase